MEDLTKIWNPIEVYTLTNRLLLIELEKPVANLKIDTVWGKVLGDERILFEFNQGDAVNYKLIGTINECRENGELLHEVIEVFPKYEEIWDIPKNDQEGWEKFPFVDESGRAYKQMGREFKYRRVSGSHYINYGIPPDVMEYFPLTSAVDSFITVLRKNGIYLQTNDYIILKQLNYERPTEE
jgi:hypothetical protein